MNYMKNLYLIIIITLSLNLQVLGKTPMPFPKEHPTEKGTSFVKSSSKLEAESLKYIVFDEKKPTLVTPNSSSPVSRLGRLETQKEETPKEQINKANSTIETINNAGNYTSFLSSEDLLHLPIGIKLGNASNEFKIKRK